MNLDVRRQLVLFAREKLGMKLISWGLRVLPATKHSNRLLAHFHDYIRDVALGLKAELEFRHAARRARAKIERERTGQDGQKVKTGEKVN